MSSILPKRLTKRSKASFLKAFLPKRLGKRKILSGGRIL
jgi:hypothetical protein